MDCCLLCLEVNKELLDSIEANSKQWQELGITKLIEKHFWALSNVQPCSWICSSCWKEVNNFHKFYMRIEEAHINFGRIKIEDGNRLSASKEAIKQEITDFQYLEPEILIDTTGVKNKDCSVTQEGNEDDLDKCPITSRDPLQKTFVSKRKNIKKLKTKLSVTRKSVHNDKVPEVKKEVSDSDDIDNASDDEGSNFEDDQNTIEYKKRKEDDKFIAEHFKQMFCDLCEAPFENFSALKKHLLLIHSIQKGYIICCNKKIFQHNHLVDHLQCHLNPDYFKCTHCGKVLSDRKNLQAHLRRVHPPKDVAPKHCCDICGKSFIMAYVLRKHILKHLPKEEKKFPCTHCGKFYASAYLLKIHTEVIHLKKLAKVCYICGKTLRTSTEYKAHMNKHAGNNNPTLNCDICGLRLISDRSLKLHKESQHPEGGKQDHPCPICNKISPTARALKKHINTMHEKGYDHKCTMCEKAFRRPEALKEHMASHTGTPLYSCPWCPKTFNSNGNMHAHRKNKHPKESLELKLQKYN